MARTLPSSSKAQAAATAAATRKERRLLIGLIAVTLAITVAVFLPSFANNFLNWDDSSNVLENMPIRAFTWPHLQAYFTQPLMGMYTPLVYISFAADFAIGALNPLTYHTTNLLLHLANVVLAGLIVFALVKRAWPAAIVAALFAVHPANVAAVAPISVRSSLLYAAFYLAAYLAYLGYLKQPSAARLGVSFLLFLLSALSKSSAIVFPLVLVLTDLYRRRAWSWKVALEKAPFFLLSLVFGIITLQFRSDRLQALSAPAYPIVERLCLACYGVMHYVRTLVAPLRLSAFYPYPERANGRLSLYVYLGPVFVLALVGLAWLWKSQRRLLAFGGLFFLINIALILKVVPLGEEFAADRYLYVASIGVFLMGVELWRHWSKRVQQAGLAVAAVLLVVFSVTAHDRVDAWKDNITFYGNIIAKYPNAVFALSNRAAAWIADRHDPAAAMRDCDAALSADAGYAEAYFNRGIAEMMLRKFPEALADANKAIELSGGRQGYLQLRAEARLAVGDAKGALADSTQAITLDPQASDIAKTYLSRGVARISLDDAKGASADFTKAIELDPKFGAAYQSRGNARALLGDSAGAIADYTKAIELDPGSAAAYVMRGRVRMLIGDRADGCRDLVQAANLGRSDARELARQLCK
jgi:tetratricopeptide (TPR) repeat protein